jgi:Protein of unknown function (DUF3309)
VPSKAASTRYENDLEGLAATIEIRRNKMSIGTILLIILVLMLIGAIPSWPHSQGWGYGPSGGIGLLLVILLILVLMGKV